MAMPIPRKPPHPRSRKRFVPNGADGHQAGSPYRPRRLPPVTQPPKLTLFFILLFGILLGFSFAHIWKAHAVNQVCIRMDSLRNRQQELLERLKAQQLQFQEMTLYSKIEPLAREMLGMRPSTKKPVIIAPLQLSAGDVQSAADIQPRSTRE